MIISECKILEIKYRYVNVLHLQNNVRWPLSQIMYLLNE
jgi:hypothetical protein